MFAALVAATGRALTALGPSARKGLLLGIAAGSATACVYLCLGPTRRYIRTHALTKLISGSAAMETSEEVRERFRRMVLADLAPRSDGHSHPTSSRLRTRADTSIDGFIKTCGYNVYSVSMSKRDINNGNDGHRLYFVAKDVALANRCDSISKHHMLKFMDTDYYCNIPDYAAGLSTMVMYTFCPKQVAGKTDDATYYFDNENNVHTTCNGGARYEHQLWDYDTDHVVFDYWWGSAFYLVESQQLSEDRRIVGLFPVRRVYGPWGWSLPGYRLRRRQVTHGAINITRYQEQSVTYVSISRPGQTFCQTLPEETLFAIIHRLDSKKSGDGNIADIERYLMKKGFDDPSVKASLLSKNLEDIIDWLHFPVLTDTGRMAEDRVNYQTLGPLVTEDAKPKAREIIPPLVVNANVAPGASYNNDSTCIQKRINETKNPVIAWKPVMHRWAEEFARLLIPDGIMHTGVPDTLETIMEKQNRPTQRAGALAALPFAFCFQTIVKSFQKGESYPKIAAPRNISTLDADHRTRYGCYIYSLTRHVLKPLRWYAFSKTPKEIANEVARVATGARFIVPTDYSAWDGTHSKPLCEFENQILRRFFHPDYHAEVSALQMTQYQAPGFTRFGVRYNTEWSRLSGSSDTSSFNTIDNAMVMYFALRDSGKTMFDAWESLGLFGGDDGIQANLDVAWINRVVKKMGHVLKAKVIEPHHPVDFLGRYYLDPWTTTASVIDVARQLRKIHITHSAPDVPWHVSLYCKAHGIMTTDALTPLLSEWAGAIMRELENTYGREVLTGKLDLHSSALKEDRKWFAAYDFPQQFPQLPLDHPLPRAFVAHQLGLTAPELTSILDRITTCKGVEILQLKHLITLPEREIAVGAVLNGEIYLPPDAPSHINDVGLSVPPTASASPASVSHAPAAAKQSRNRSGDPRTTRAAPRNSPSESDVPASLPKQQRRDRRKSSAVSLPNVRDSSSTTLESTTQSSRNAQFRHSDPSAVQPVSALSRDQQQRDNCSPGRPTDPPRSDGREHRPHRGRVYYHRPSVNQRQATTEG